MVHVWEEELRKILIAAFLVLLSANAAADDTAAKLFSDARFQQYMQKYYKNGVIREDGSLRSADNKAGFHLLDQSIGMHAIAIGIGNGNARDIELGIKSIGFGMDKIFPGQSLENSSISHASRFLFNIALGYQELKNSGNYSKNEYLAFFQTEKNRIERLVYAVFKTQQFENDKPGILTSANQLISLGILYSTFADLCGNREFYDLADQYFSLGFSLISDDGIFFEKGGFDSSYQAFNLLLLSYIYLYKIPVQGYSEANLLDLLAKGWKYELKFIGPEGHLDSSKNTRTGNQQEIWQGKFKPVNTTEAALSLLYWSFISRDSTFSDLSYAIYKNYQ
jgi:hypothetical protein